MIRTLHRRLAALLISAISLALLGASGAALIASERQLSLREESAFLNQLTALTQDVRMERSLANTRLAKAEAVDRLILRVYDNGQPIAFRGGWQPDTPRDDLFARALGAAAQAGVSPDSATDARWTGALRGDRGERYLAAVQSIGGYRSRRAVALLMDMQKQDAERIAQRWLFAAITLGAMAGMAAFGWRFTARAVKPIGAAHDRQNAFLAAASHEFRTPLQVMQSSLDALKSSPTDPVRFTDAMQRELRHMRRLSEDLMLLTGATDARPSTARFGPVELRELAEDAVRDHLDAAAEKQIALTFIEPSTPPPLIEGDAPLLCRAIYVLVDNALCYTQSGGHVEVSIQVERKFLCLHVKDDGPGIAPEHRPFIFDRFYRVDPSRTSRIHSGLGLSIAQQIAVQHNGRLSHHTPSTPVGIVHGASRSVAHIDPRPATPGSLFSLRLPRLPRQ